MLRECVLNRDELLAAIMIDARVIEYRDDSLVITGYTSNDVSHELQHSIDRSPPPHKFHPSLNVPTAQSNVATCGERCLKYQHSQDANFIATAGSDVMHNFNNKKVISG